MALKYTMNGELVSLPDLYHQSLIAEKVSPTTFYTRVAGLNRFEITLTDVDNLVRKKQGRVESRTHYFNGEITPVEEIYKLLSQRCNEENFENCDYTAFLGRLKKTTLSYKDTDLVKQSTGKQTARGRKSEALKEGTTIPFWYDLKDLWSPSDV